MSEKVELDVGVGDEDNEGLAPVLRDAVGVGDIDGVASALPDARTEVEAEKDVEEEGVMVPDTVGEAVATEVLVFVDVGDCEAVLDAVGEDVLRVLGESEGLEPTERDAVGVAERDRDELALGVIVRVGVIVAVLLCVPVIVPETVSLKEPVGDSVDVKDAYDSVELGVQEGDAPSDSVPEVERVTVPVSETSTVPVDVPVNETVAVAEAVGDEVVVIEEVLVLDGVIEDVGENVTGADGETDGLAPTDRDTVGETEEAAV